MNILFFDTETTGKPLNYKAHMTDVNNWPRVIQLGWQVADSEHERVLCDYNHLILPDGWVIPREDFWIEHGFSTEKNVSEGKAMPVILDSFLQDLASCELMVAHNIGFDYPVLGAEMIRYQKRSGRRVDKFCTMEAGINQCKIPFSQDRRPWMNKGRGYKWPKLEELYRHLFASEMSGAHDAGSDVTACRLCYFEMASRGISQYQQA